MSDTNDPNRAGAPQPQPQQSEVRIRRAPKLPAFLIVGGGLGAIVTFVLTALFPVDPEVGFFALFGYLALYGVTAGVLLGGVIAIILDRRADKRATTASATVESATTSGSPAPGSLDFGQHQSDQPESEQPEFDQPESEQRPEADPPRP
ncbi:hypothetical protein [Glaciihabitans tibetensis]|uniref:hypothetical protein n=1 Tax=Glaciihabitans tibetensis TaxID=1266600 RepID=UPI000D075346|nr:hypothetical protein [Glaciihabitans tibetensis]